MEGDNPAYFSTLPDELVSLIFSQINKPSEIRSKIKLERVCKRFSRLLTDGQAWNLNKTLILSDFQTRESLASFLDRVPEISRVTLVTQPFNRRIASELFAFGEKLRVSNFIYNGVSFGDECQENEDVVSCLMGHFRSTLKSLNFSACDANNCLLCHHFESLISLCPNLENVRLRNIVSLIDFPSVFAGKPLKRLILDEGGSAIAGIELAEMANSVATASNSLTELRIVREGPEWFVKRFTFSELPQFLENLQPAAAGALKIFDFQVKGTHFHVVPTIPTVMPNLKYLKASLVAKGGFTALQTAEVIGEFMHSNSRRTCDILMDLSVVLNDGESQEVKNKFGQDLWKFVNLLNICKGGTRRTEDTSKWKRSLRRRTAQINLCYPEW